MLIRAVQLRHISANQLRTYYSSQSNLNVKTLHSQLYETPRTDDARALASSSRMCIYIRVYLTCSENERRAGTNFSRNYLYMHARARRGYCEYNRVVCVCVCV